MEGNAAMITYNDNIAQVVLNIEDKLKTVSEISKLNRTIGSYVVASNLRRIHNDGIALDGSIIGNYSVKPIYINPKNSPRKFEPKGKTGRSFFKTSHGIKVNKPHKTRYFIAGYFGFRGTIGREISKVNLQLSGKLLKDWIMEPQGDNVIIGFRSRYGTNISNGNEIRFGKKIYGISQKDIEQIEVIKNDFIKNALA